ncbi:hypothetical protein [Capsulimonas corticalis]|uniref:hypothetical protein n=1 Tax=Capsulimonas corticalis TaxID=2219043 RepID=UPI002626C379|nr:hypothetical protein [Capsulimonas corticalis]
MELLDTRGASYGLPGEKRLVSDLDMHMFVNGFEREMHTDDKIRQVIKFLETVLERAPKRKAPASRKRTSPPAQPALPLTSCDADDDPYPPTPVTPCARR